MILCIPNGYQPKKNCCQTDGSFSFSASIQEVILNFPKIKVLERKKGSKFDTTLNLMEERISHRMTAALRELSKSTDGMEQLLKFKG